MISVAEKALADVEVDEIPGFKRFVKERARRGVRGGAVELSLSDVGKLGDTGHYVRVMR